LQGPFVILFDHHSSNQSDDGALIGEDPHDVGPAFYFGIEPLKRIGAMDLKSVRAREAGEREDVLFGSFHHLRQFRELLAQLVGDQAPLGTCRFRTVLHEDGIDHSEHRLALALVGIGQGVAQEVDLAALPSRLQDLADSRLEAFVRV